MNKQNISLYIYIPQGKPFGEYTDDTTFKLIFCLFTSKTQDIYSLLRYKNTDHEMDQFPVVFVVKKKVGGLNKRQSLGDFLCILTPNSGQLNPLFDYFAEFRLIVKRFVPLVKLYLIHTLLNMTIYIMEPKTTGGRFLLQLTKKQCLCLGDRWLESNKWIFSPKPRGRQNYMSYFNS